jgi:2-haloacid dehalogenase/putative hydrolase of the HAD superfamily
MGTLEAGFVTVREDFKNSLVRVLTELGAEGDLQGYSERVLDRMFDSLHTAALFPEVPGVLAALEDAGIPWGIVSNVDEADLRAVISHHGLRPACAVSSERVVTYKPKPLIFHKALEEMGGLEPTRVLHSGDTPNADVVGATVVGLDVLWLNRYEIPFPAHLTQPTYETIDLDPLPRLVLEGQL